VNYLIALDDGHGMETPGKRTPVFPDGTVMKENEFNKAVVNYLKAELERCGFRTLLVAPEDTDTPLSTRCNRANTAGAHLYVSVHANANTGQWGDWGGIETYTWNKGDSLRIGKLIHQELLKGTQLTDRGVKDGTWLYVLKNTKMPAVLVECGFMDSRKDADYLRKESYRKECAVEIAKGICKGFGVPYKPEAAPVTKPAEPAYDHGKHIAEAVKKLGIITDAVYWEDVIEGRIVPKPVYVQYLFENIIKRG